MINKSNYEAYLLDHLEGNLTEKEERELMLFLELHPELEAIPEDLGELRLTPERVEYEGKDTLRKADLSFESVDDLNVEQAMVAYHEGELSQEQRQRLEAYLVSHPARVEDLRLYGKVFLTPPAVSFEKKNNLFRKQRKIAVWMPAVAAGAALLLAFTFFLRQQEGSSVHNPSSGVAEVARTTPVSAAVHPEQKSRETTVARGADAQVARTTMPEKKKMWTDARVSTKQSAATPEKNIQLLAGLLQEGPTVRLPLRQVPLPVRINNTSLATPAILPVTPPQESDENIDLLAAKTGLRIRRNLLKKETQRKTPREIFFTGLQKINAATGLNLNYERMEEPQQGREYVAVTSRFFSYMRRREENK